MAITASIIATARRAAGMSQQQLARAARTAQSTVSEYESGRKSPTLAVVERLLAAADADLVVVPRVEFFYDQLPDGSNQRPGNSYAPLDPLSPADQKLLQTYDTSQNTGASSGSIPFLDFGGHYVSAGASYSPGMLAGLSHQQVATDMSDPSSRVAQAIIGTANILTADLCTLTGQKPAAVCDSAGVTAAR